MRSGPRPGGLAAAILLGAGLQSAPGAIQPVIQLWPGGAPGAPATAEAERDLTTGKDPDVAGKPLIRLGNVTDPSMTVYRPAQGSGTGTAVLVFPGGGYHILALDLEGTEVCQWLASKGVTAVLVKYRVPQPAQQERYAQPLQDAERAIGLVRAHAKEWNLKADRIGVLGFSAGAHLAAVLGDSSGKRTYPAVDAADTETCRPDFALLIYPAYLSVRDEGEQVAPEVTPTPQTPPTFIVQTEDDKNFVEGSLLYYRALKHAGVPAEMHLYGSGGHGYGLRHSEARVTGWPRLAEDWLRSLKLID